MDVGRRDGDYVVRELFNCYTQIDSVRKGRGGGWGVGFGLFRIGICGRSIGLGQDEKMIMLCEATNEKQKLQLSLSMGF